MSIADHTPLRDARDEASFGGKAIRLADALRQGLPVPPGVALSVEEVERLATSPGPDDEVRAGRVIEALGGRVAVRSSAVGEDAAGASFAGQHTTILAVTGGAELVEAVGAVHRSGHAIAAIAYRERLGIGGFPRMGVVIQQMIDADVAGVMFTVHPITGADERVIEASWGLGEAIVAGLVDPDRFRLRRGGEMLERVVSHKDVAVRTAAGGGAFEVPVSPDLADVACLDTDQLSQLDRLASRCEATSTAPLDIEWCFAGATLHLLQWRDVTGRR